ncbi:MAG TPA: hypothetical protein VK510_21625, partial [Solirubrobacteraceae bacterium]|nr:hypothetical protein [Solirubrobacteraceae bacterium]
MRVVRTASAVGGVRCARLLALAAAAAAALVALAASPASAASDPPWRVAEAMRAALFEAQSALIVDGPAEASEAVTRARSLYRGPLAADLRRADPSADRDVRRSLAAAARAALAGDDTRLAAARGAARAAVFRGAFAATLAAVDRGDARGARDWLLLREFRTATRFTRPGADATVALAQLQRGRLSRPAAHAAVAKDLLDAYQARLRELLDDAARGEERDLPVRRAEAAAQAEGYFAILAPRYRQDRGAGAAA